MAFKKILLIKPPGRKGLGFASDVIPIGLEYIAASLEEIVDEVNIIDLELEQSSFQYFLDTLNPDLVATQCRQPTTMKACTSQKLQRERAV